MTDTQHFNITQSSKLADYLRKFDKSFAKKSDIGQESTLSSNEIKRKFTVDDEFNVTSKRRSFYNERITDRSIDSKEKKKKIKKNEDLTEDNNRSERLKHQMMEKLMHSQFRNINQYLYENPTVQAIRYMSPDLFRKYHESYAQLVEKWPVKPLDIIISEIEHLSAFNKRSLRIADMGCGEAKLAKHFKEIESQTIIDSFDLVELNDRITKASIDNVPLEDGCSDIVVFCLSLMPTNIRDCIIEANRILKKNGLVYIAEVVSRFEDNKFKVFTNSMEQFGFKLNKLTVLEPDNYFVLFRFKKCSLIEKLKGLPGIHLKPCKYKTR